MERNGISQLQGNSLAIRLKTVRRCDRKEKVQPSGYKINRISLIVALPIVMRCGEQLAGKWRSNDMKQRHHVAKFGVVKTTILKSVLIKQRVTLRPGNLSLKTGLI